MQIPSDPHLFNVQPHRSRTCKNIIKSSHSGQIRIKQCEFEGRILYNLLRQHEAKLADF